MKIIKYITATILAFLILGCDEEEEKIIRPVETLKIKKENKLNSKNFSGIVISETSPDLAFRVEGQIEKIFVKDGEKVSKGKILARLDNIIYKIEENEMEAKLNDSKNVYQNAKSYFKRIDMLHSEGAISDSDFEKAYTNMKSAEFGIKIAKERLELAKQKSSYGFLRAPTNGIITLKIKNEGDYVGAKDTIFKFISGEYPKIEITIPQNYIDEFKIGEKCEIELDSISEKKFKGEIYSISPSSIDRSGYLAKINILESNPKIYPGMSGQVYFKKKNDKNEKIWVPLSATMSDNKGIYVYIVEEKEEKTFAKKEYVEIGELISGEIEITKGLTSGDRIVTKGVSKIQNKQEIRILNK